MNPLLIIPMVTVLILSPALIILACWHRKRTDVPTPAPGFMTPHQVRSLSFAKGDLLVITTEQHLTRAQMDSLREWTDAFEAAHGIKVVVMGGGLKPEMLLKTKDSEGEIDQLGSGFGERMRKVAEDEIARHMKTGGLLWRRMDGDDVRFVDASAFAVKSGEVYPTRPRLQKLIALINKANLTDDIPGRQSVLKEAKALLNKFDLAEAPFGVGPGGMVGPPGTVFDPRVAMFIPKEPDPSEGPEGRQ